MNPKIPDFKELNLPPIYEKVTDSAHEGLVIVCGVTGSGKSSTLAAMIDHINERRACNIITIEDPVEYLFRPKQSFISQREIGIDVPDFPSALRTAVRQDPDVLMIGELRDRETMLAGIQAAETGHLVFVTLHTADTMQAFSRILEFFPTKDHAFIRSSLAVGLKAVMAQRLLPSVKPGVQRVPATEVLLNTRDRGRPHPRRARTRTCPRSWPARPRRACTTSPPASRDWSRRTGSICETAERYAPNAEALRGKVRGIQVKADVLVSKSR